MNEIPSEVLANASEIYAGLTIENGKPYRPSNGTEGQIFMSRWCYKCTKDSSENQKLFCGILTYSLCGEQPKEWIYCDNKPVCTAFNPKE